MILGIGGLVVGLIDSFVGIAGYTNYFVYLGIAFLMTLARFIKWSALPPYEKPSIKFIVLGFYLYI